jgi:hypothetical protein
MATRPAALIEAERRNPMAAIEITTQVERYEYRFVRIGEYGGSSLFGVRDSERNKYEQVVHEHARDGWRLVQIFAPGTAAFGAARFYELIFERPWPEDAPSE